MRPTRRRARREAFLSTTPHAVSNFQSTQSNPCGATIAKPIPPGLLHRPSFRKLPTKDRAFHPTLYSSPNRNSGACPLCSPVACLANPACLSNPAWSANPPNHVRQPKKPTPKGPVALGLAPIVASSLYKSNLVDRILRAGSIGTGIRLCSMVPKRRSMSQNTWPNGPSSRIGPARQIGSTLARKHRRSQSMHNCPVRIHRRPRYVPTDPCAAINRLGHTGLHRCEGHKCGRSRSNRPSANWRPKRGHSSLSARAHWRSHHDRRPKTTSFPWRGKPRWSKSPGSVR